ncbi:hypothetical protein BJF85_10765 [Saccharomonospora sp. CUA-673]|uniref:DUF6292 family protein n=1 Tax=Saccharomonospora sp. CUA-673 TaxID=1904969 RepID=UPI000965B0BB|nr:DUF6292 family protein [Saccharomonospora sp. CUA-673]OLT48943.1 hypothetical protein BJF85_10765 [Saccharomonospora sp. CUA-673]
MDIYGWHSTESALHAYAAAVTEAVPGAAQYTCDAAGTPVSAYIALDGHLPTFPDRDFALVWDERHGWGAAIETHSGEDLIMVSYLGGADPVPDPATVGRFARQLLAGGSPGQPDPPDSDRLPELPSRLLAAAGSSPAADHGPAPVL